MTTKTIKLSGPFTESLDPAVCKPERGDEVTLWRMHRDSQTVQFEVNTVTDHYILSTSGASYYYVNGWEVKVIHRSVVLPTAPGVYEAERYRIEDGYAPYWLNEAGDWFFDGSRYNEHMYFVGSLHKMASTIGGKA